MADVTVGSVWRERDNRFERYVVVLALPGPHDNGKVTIQTCASNGQTFGTPRTRANIKAFGSRYKPCNARSGE